MILVQQIQGFAGGSGCPAVNGGRKRIVDPFFILQMDS